MSKLDYSGEADNGVGGWQENFGDDLVIPETTAQQLEPVAVEQENNYNSMVTESGNFEQQQQQSYSDEAVYSEENVEPPVVEAASFEPPPPPVQEQTLEVNNNPVSVTEMLQEPPSNEGVPPPPPLFMSPPEPMTAPPPLSNFVSDLASTLPSVEQSPRAFTTPAVATPPVPTPPLTYPVIQASKADSTKVPTPTVRPVAQAPTLSPRTGSELGTRKPLTFPQANITYKQPMDYAALLSNAVARTATVTRVNQGAAVKPTQPVATSTQATLNSAQQALSASQQIKAAAAAVVAQQQQRQASLAAYTSKVNQVNPNIMSYPPQPTRNGTSAPPVAAPVVAKPQPPPPVQVATQPPPQVVQPVNFPKSQTMPEMPPDTQQQQLGGSEQEPASKPSHSEERRTKKHRHRVRQTNFYQQPPVDQYQMGYFTENPQSYYDMYYRQWYETQARMYGSLSGASTPANYGESDSEYDPNASTHSRPSSRMSVGAYASPQTSANPYMQYMQQAQQVQQYPGTAPGGGYDPATAAWWYYMQYYMQQQPQQTQPQRPSTPKKFAYPHCRATFTPSGFLVTILPGRNAYAGPGSTATRVTVMRTFDTLSPTLTELKEFTDFPGPLVPNESHKIDIVNFAQRMSQQALDSDYLDRDSVNLLWRFIELLVRQNGTYFGADISQLLTEMIPPLPEQLIEPADQAIQAPPGSIQQLRDLLIHGRKREAVEFATNRNLWAHAMFLSHSISEQYFLAVRNRFLAASAAPGDPLATFYQLATLSSPVISRQAVTSDMHSWRQHLAVILSNAAVSPQFQRQLLLSLGDTLRSQSRLYAAQLCYLMAGDQFSTFPPVSTSSDGFSSSTRMILLGTEPHVDFLRLAKPYFCQMTEMYEYCMRLANPRAVLPAFQLFKAFYCLCLAENGLAHEAFRYLMSLVESLQICFNTYPMMSNCFPRPCFKWLYDLYIALHKSEPAIDPSTIEWVCVAAKGGPIQPPSLSQQQQMMAQQQQQQGYYNSRPDEFRQMAQTPYQQPQQQVQQPPQPQLQPQQHQSQQQYVPPAPPPSVPNVSQPPAAPTQAPPPPVQNVQRQPSVHETPQLHNPSLTQAPSSSQHSETLPSFAKSYGGGVLPPPPQQPPNPQFGQSGRFGQSISRRSDGSDLPFGSSIESLTSLNNMMADMRRTVAAYATDTSHPEQLQQQVQQQFPKPPSAEPVEDNSQPEHPYVSPLSTWQPGPINQSQPRFDSTREVAPTPPLSSSSQQDRSPKKSDDPNKTSTPSGVGFIASMRNWSLSKLASNNNPNGKPSKEMVLPDDSKPTLVFDKEKNRWIDTSNKDGDVAADELPPPPPPMMMPPVPAANPMMPAMTAPTMGLQMRPRSRYVDVFKPASTDPALANGPTNSFLRPPLFPSAQPLARMFVPPPVAPDPS